MDPVDFHVTNGLLLDRRGTTLEDTCPVIPYNR